MRSPVLTVPLLTLGGIALTLCSCAATSSSETSASPSAAAASTLLAVQSERGRLTPTSDGQYTLLMRGTESRMAAFADRPVREGTAVSTAELPRVWNLGGDQSFTADPPNAAITTHTNDGRMRVVTGTLTDPNYDQDTEVLTFTVTPLDPAVPPTTAAELGKTSVLIDGAIPLTGTLTDPDDAAGLSDPTPVAIPTSDMFLQPGSDPLAGWGIE